MQFPNTYKNDPKVLELQISHPTVSLLSPEHISARSSISHVPALVHLITQLGTIAQVNQEVYVGPLHPRHRLSSMNPESQ